MIKVSYRLKTHPIRHKSKHKKIVKYQLLINLRNQHKTVSEERKGAFI